jgi:diguanylate cyclase (GGDEF)-like protein
MDSNVGLAIQCAGIYLVALLSFFMTRSIKRMSLEYWTVAWLCLAVSLSILSLAFRYETLRGVLYPAYLFGEYAFGYFFCAGCRFHATGKRLTPQDLLILIPGAAFAIALSRFSNDFNAIFMIHAGVMGTLFAIAIYSMLSGPRRKASSPGLRVMSTALALLAIDFFHYVPIFSSVIIWQPFLPSSYLRYTSIYDLILETLLGFGTIMIVMEDVHRKLEIANGELTSARDKLEVLASLDPLTGALNRYAFQSLVARPHDRPVEPQSSGWLAVVDVDDLKQLNDSFGHTSGDAVIRGVATAIRSVIRPGDLVYRWGGDEYLVMMFAIPESEAHARIGALNESLMKTKLPGLSVPLTIRVSYGLSYFASVSDVQQSIERADSAMYQCKMHKREKPEVRQESTLTSPLCGIASSGGGRTFRYPDSLIPSLGETCLN